MATRAGVRLRQARLDDAEMLDAWHRPEMSGEFNDFGLAYPSTRQAILDDGLVSANRGTLIVERVSDREPVGTVSWRAVHYGPNPESRAWNIGISLVPEARGRGLGAEAQRLLAEHLFATTSVHRVEAMTDVDNVPEQRSLEKAGFHREGVMRAAQFRAGRWHDIVLYAAVRPAPG